MKKKIYISVDLEGITGVSKWDETERGNYGHDVASKQMTLEVISAIKGIRKIFKDSEIFIKDAHDSGRNLILDMFTMDNVKILRGWTGSQLSMLQNIDETFDAIVMIGYHSGAYTNTNPLSHTMNQKNTYFKINDVYASEFDMHYIVAKEMGIPVVFISGDRGICQRAKSVNPNITTVATKEGIGNGCIENTPLESLNLIEKNIGLAMKNLDKIKLNPQAIKCNCEINYVEHMDALRASYYPNVSLLDAKTVSFSTDTALDMMTTKMFIL